MGVGKGSASSRSVHPLRRERELRGWSQAEVARLVGAPSHAHVSRWERGVVVPSPHYRERFCRIFECSAADLGFLQWGADGTSLLPVPPTPLVGRDGELAVALALLRDTGARLVTLTGPPGVGKSRLGLAAVSAVRRRFPDGVFFVDLAPLANADLVGKAVADGLGLPEPARDPATSALAAYLAGRRTLLVLDNFEHLLDALPLLVELLDSCPMLRLLVTSRVSLRLRAERELCVAPLALADAVSLFLARAGDAVPDFRVGEGDRDTVAAICERLDRLPLALELAAPWVKLLPPSALLERLDQRLPLLTDGAPDLPERQRTMRETLAWSCALLGPEPLMLFRCLSVFAGGASLAAVECLWRALDGPPGRLLPNLKTLVDHNLVQQQEAPAGEIRVRMLETVREYGRELLADSGEADRAAGAHLRYYVELAARSPHSLLGREHDNMRAALWWSLAHGEAGLGLELAMSLEPFWASRGHRREGLAYLTRLLAVADSTPRLRADGLRAAGLFAAFDGDLRSALGYLEESLAIGRGAAGDFEVGRILGTLGQVECRRGDWGRAHEHLTEAVELLRRSGEPEELTMALHNLGILAAHSGDRRQAIDIYEDALRVAKRRGYHATACMCMINLGNNARILHASAQSRNWLREAVDLARALNLGYLTGAALAASADLSRDEDALHEARSGYCESLRIFAEVGNRDGIVHCLRWLAWLHWREGRPRQAVRLYGAAEGCRPPVDRPLDQEDHAAYDAARTAIRADLGDVIYERELELGRRLTTAEAVAEACAI